MRAHLLVCVALMGCGPALELRRLSPPRAVLGTARTVLVQVTPASLDELPGEPTRVSDELRRRVSERVTAAGYVVCTEPGCGDGVLQVVLTDFSAGGDGEMQHRPSVEMMDAAMKALRAMSPGVDATARTTTVAVTTTGPVTVRLKGHILLQQADGKVRALDEFMHFTTRTGKPGEVVRQTLDEVAKGLGQRLSRQAPLIVVPLEGGGPLNRGVELLHAANWAGAAEYFTELTRTQPELDGAWYDLGFALEAQNAWAPALRAYEEAARRAQKPHYERAVSAVRSLLSGSQR